jgi:hypothetical protein
VEEFGWLLELAASCGLGRGSTLVTTARFAVASLDSSPGLWWCSVLLRALFACSLASSPNGYAYAKCRSWKHYFASSGCRKGCCILQRPPSTHTHPQGRLSSALVPASPLSPLPLACPQPPSFPILAVAGTNCRGGCTRGCDKLTECPHRPLSLCSLSFLQKPMQIGELLETISERRCMVTTS